jgi:hypothetical protein
MKDPSETADESACLRFARDFLPVVNQALAKVHLENASSEKDSGADDSTVAADDADKDASTTASDSANRSDEVPDLFGGQADTSTSSADDRAAPEKPAAAPSAE